VSCSRACGAGRTELVGGSLLKRKRVDCVQQSSNPTRRDAINGFLRQPVHEHRHFFQHEPSVKHGPTQAETESWRSKASKRRGRSRKQRSETSSTTSKRGSYTYSLAALCDEQIALSAKEVHERWTFDSCGGYHFAGRRNTFTVCFKLPALSRWKGYKESENRLDEFPSPRLVHFPHTGKSTRTWIPGVEHFYLMRTRGFLQGAPATPACEYRI
jgi:hypothetical protein